jgi:NADH-quinone oxidoreductase subunit N
MIPNFFIAFKQELGLTVILFLLLFIRLGKKEVDNKRLLGLVNGLLFVHVVLGFAAPTNARLFGDMFISTPLDQFGKHILGSATLIVSLLAWPWLRHHKHVPEFYMLLVTTLLGMYLMLSTVNLLMLYLGLELATIPLAALVNFDLDKKRASEGAMKMILSSALASGLLLFGISLLYGATGSIDYYGIMRSLSTVVVPPGMSSAMMPPLVFGPMHIFAFVLIVAGLGFKISAVPFHFWTADVYEGAPVPVTAYLSVVSKAATLFVLLFVLYGIFLFRAPMVQHILTVLSMASMIIGNLFALRQQNIKRFLAFSSIAQVGFILAGMSGIDSASVVYFIVVYVFSNLGAFAVVTLVSTEAGREQIADYRGFYKTNPALGWVMTLSLFSLAGIPPLAGFFGKFFLLMGSARQGSYTLLIVAALNMVVSLYYYLRVVKAMFMEEQSEPVAPIRPGRAAWVAMLICIAGMLVAGLYSGLYAYIHRIFMGSSV